MHVSIIIVDRFLEAYLAGGLIIIGRAHVPSSVEGTLLFDASNLFARDWWLRWIMYSLACSALGRPQSMIILR